MYGCIFIESFKIIESGSGGATLYTSIYRGSDRRPLIARPDLDSVDKIEHIFYNHSVAFLLFQNIAVSSSAL
jgi:hypothetical protein